MLIKIEFLLEELVKKLAKKRPELSINILRSLIFPRFYSELLSAKFGFLRFGKLYKYPIIIILGLPKSGTTWLEKSLESIPGFRSTMFPDMLFWGLKNQESLHYEFTAENFRILKNKLLIVKTHSQLSENNLKVLKTHNAKYIIVYRDIRDVAISYAHFVSSRPWHPSYRVFSKLNFEESLIYFAKNLGHDYIDWIRNSIDLVDSNGLIITYEEMQKAWIQH